MCRIEILDGFTREGQIEVMLDMKEGAILVSGRGIRKSIPGGRISEYKGSEAGACPVGLRKQCFVLTHFIQP